MLISFPAILLVKKFYSYLNEKKIPAEKVHWAFYITSWSMLQKAFYITSWSMLHNHALCHCKQLDVGRVWIKDEKRKKNPMIEEK